MPSAPSCHLSHRSGAPCLLERVRHSGLARDAARFRVSWHAVTRFSTVRKPTEGVGTTTAVSSHVLLASWEPPRGVWARVRPREVPAPSPRDVALHAARRLRPLPGTRAAHRTPDCAPHPFPDSKEAGPYQRARARVAARRCRSPAPAAEASRPDKTDT